MGSRFSYWDPLRWQNLVFRRPKRRSRIVPLHSRTSATRSAQIAREVSDDDGPPGNVDRFNSDMVRRDPFPGLDRSRCCGVAHRAMDWPGWRGLVLRGAEHALSRSGRSEVSRELDDYPHRSLACDDESPDDRGTFGLGAGRGPQRDAATRSNRGRRWSEELSSFVRSPCDVVDGTREPRRRR